MTPWGGHRRDAAHSQEGLAFEPGFLLLRSKNIPLGFSNAWIPWPGKVNRWVTVKRNVCETGNEIWDPSTF